MYARQGGRPREGLRGLDLNLLSWGCHGLGSASAAPRAVLVTARDALFAHSVAAPGPVRLQHPLALNPTSPDTAPTRPPCRRYEGVGGARPANHYRLMPTSAGACWRCGDSADRAIAAARSILTGARSCVRPCHVLTALTASSSGYVILPTRFAPGWDGKGVKEVQGSSPRMVE